MARAYPHTPVGVDAYCCGCGIGQCGGFLHLVGRHFVAGRVENGHVEVFHHDEHTSVGELGEETFFVVAGHAYGYRVAHRSPELGTQKIFAAACHHYVVAHAHSISQHGADVCAAIHAVEHINFAAVERARQYAHVGNEPCPMAIERHNVAQSLAEIGRIAEYVLVKIFAHGIERRVVAEHFVFGTAHHHAASSLQAGHYSPAGLLVKLAVVGFLVAGSVLRHHLETAALKSHPHVFLGIAVECRYHNVFVVQMQVGVVHLGEGAVFQVIPVKAVKRTV